MNEIENTLGKGTVLHGQLDYTIESCLGQGGFGITYLANGEMQIKNIKHKLKFTIKEFFMKGICTRSANGQMEVSHGNETCVEEHKKSFMKEAERLSTLGNHPGIVGVNEIFCQNGTVYYVMEYLGDINLHTYVKQHDGKLSEKEAMPIFKQMAEALQHLHNKKITHLDVKPANVMMTQDSTPVLIDFGLAIHFGKSDAPTSENKTICCTDGFSPLEQYMGINTFEPEADIYSLGATLLYMLTGENPPMANKMDGSYVDDIIGKNVSSKVCGIIKKCMAKLPEQRYRTINELLSQINIPGTQPADDFNDNVTRIIGEKRVKPKPQMPAWTKYAVIMFVCTCLAIFIVKMAMDYWPQPQPEPIEDTISVEQQDTIQTPYIPDSPSPEPQPKPQPEPSPIATEGTIDLSYATYEGELKHGKPDGYGKLTFKEAHIIENNDRQKREAEAGDVVSGTFIDGHLTKGRWTQSSQDTTITIIIGN